MESASKVYLNMRDWFPYPNKPLVLKTKYGIREGVWGIFMMGFYLTDCTHPMQNAHISMYDVMEWRYANESDMNNLLFTKNTWMRESEGAEILRHIPKNKNIIRTLINKIKSII